MKCRLTTELLLPARSVAWTSTVWPPGARPLNVTPDEHGVNAPWSRRHANDADSFAWKVIDGDELVVAFGFADGESIVRLGAAVSATPVDSARPTPVTPVPEGSSTARSLSPPPTASPPTFA